MKLIGCSYQVLKKAIAELEVNKTFGFDKRGRPLLSLNELNATRQHLASKRGGSKYKIGKEVSQDRETFFLPVMNYKGGSGKSTTTHNLSHYLGFKGWKVLIMDFDPQGSLTYLNGINPFKDISDPYYETVRRLFTDKDLIESGAKLPVMKTNVENVDIIPGHSHLYGLEMDLDPDDVDNIWWLNLKKAKDVGMFDEYDIVLIDTSPSFSALSIAAIYAADMLLLPVYPSPLSLWSLSELYGMIGDTFARIEAIDGHSPELVDIVHLPTMFSKTKIESNTEDLQEMRDYLGPAVLEVEMYRKGGICEAAAFFSSAYEFSLSSESPNRPAETAVNELNRVNSVIEKRINRAWDRVSAKSIKSEISKDAIFNL
jgi:chromosome partitioning protein